MIDNILFIIILGLDVPRPVQMKPTLSVWLINEIGHTVYSCVCVLGKCEV